MVILNRKPRWYCEVGLLQPYLNSLMSCTCFRTLLSCDISLVKDVQNNMFDVPYIQARSSNEIEGTARTDI